MSDSVETEIKDLSKLLQDGRKRKATLTELIARDDAASAKAIARWISTEARVSFSKAEKLMPQAAEALSRMPKSGTAALLGLLNLEGSEHVRRALVALGDSEQVRAAAMDDMARWAERHAAVSPVLAPLDERLRVLGLAHLFGKPLLYGAVITPSDGEALDALVPALGERVQGDRNSKDFASYARSLRVLWQDSDRFWPLVQVLLAQSAVVVGFAREVLDHPCVRVSQQIDQIVTGLPAAEGKSLQDTLLARLSDPQLEIASGCARALEKVAPQLYPAAVRDVLGRWPMDMQLGFLPSLLANGDQDAIYATIETELGGPNWHSAVCALEAIDTPRAVEMLLATGMSGNLPDGGQRIASALAGIQITTNWMKEPSALQALRTLLGAKSATMRQHASDWLVRRERKEQGIADWYTVPKGATPSGGGAAAANAPRATNALPQRNGHPLAERAKSARSKCIVCGEKIEKDALRLGVLRLVTTASFSKEGTAWLHVECWQGCPELQGIDDLDAALRANSPDVWTENRFPLVGLVAPAEWSEFTDWLEVQEDCGHDEDCYRAWFEAKGAPDAGARSARLYKAMGPLASTGPCACAAAQTVWHEYPAPR